MQREPAIDVRGVGKRFGMMWVLRGASFQIDNGEVVGLLGANGSGKSTLIRILATLLKANVGTALIGGIDVMANPSGVRNQVGYLAHAAGLYEDLTARENLEFAAKMLALSGHDADATLDRVGLGHAAGSRVRGFSAGMQRRLALARVIMKKPRVLLFDEPYANLDAEGIDLMNSVIAEVVGSGGAALLALHELAPSRPVLSRTTSLSDGRITPTEGKAKPQLRTAAAV